MVSAGAGGEPQIVTRRGVETAVVISQAEFERLSTPRVTSHGTFANSLLAIPRAETDDIDRIEIALRDLDA